jgi:phenylpyruvate tautomerase PptA (4-oxalocrotonate tautomerase family)
MTSWVSKGNSDCRTQELAMPMIDAHIPLGALAPEAERALIARLTEILIRAEGYDPVDPTVRNVTVVYLHRPEVFVAGAPAEAPRYRIDYSVPEGQLDDQRSARVVGEITEAVLDAEQGARPRSAARVWVFSHDVPEGTWGSRGKIQRLADIVAHLGGDPSGAPALAAARLAARRAERGR